MSITRLLIQSITVPNGITAQTDQTNKCLQLTKLYTNTVGILSLIGKYNVKKSVELLGGTIRAESAPDVGTTITLRLPLNKELP